MERPHLFECGTTIMDLMSTTTWILPTHIRSDSFIDFQLCPTCLGYYHRCLDDQLMQYLVYKNQEYCAHHSHPETLHFSSILSKISFSDDHIEMKDLIDIMHMSSNSDHVFATIMIVESLIESVIHSFISLNIGRDDEFQELMTNKFKDFFGQFHKVECLDHESNYIEKLIRSFLVAYRNNFIVSLPLNISKDKFWQIIGNVVNNFYWNKIMGIVEKYSVSVVMETHLIADTMEWLRGLDAKSIEVLLSKPYWQNMVRLSYNFLGDRTYRCSTTVLDQQRDVNRLIQALQMAPQSEIKSAESGTAINPFADWAFRGLLLCPHLQPLHVIDKSKPLILDHSCIPNSEIAPRFDSASGTYSFSLVATRDIMEGENILFNFSSPTERCSCLKCLPKVELNDLFSQYLLNVIPSSSSSLVTCLEDIFFYFSFYNSTDHLEYDGRRTRSRKRRRSQKMLSQGIPWYNKLRMLNSYIVPVPLNSESVSIAPSYLVEWRSFADSLSSSSSQFDCETSIFQLAGAIAIYVSLLTIARTIQKAPENHHFVGWKAEISLSLVASIMEILTASAQLKIEDNGLSLKVDSMLDEIEILRTVALIGLEGSEGTANPCKAVQSLQLFLSKHDTFKPFNRLNCMHEVVGNRMLYYGDPSEELLVVAETTAPILSNSDCRAIIDDAEATALRSGMGWTTSRHYSVPTTDLPVTALSADIQALILDRVAKKLLPFMYSIFKNTITTEPTRQQNFGALVFDLFVVKYSAEVDPEVLSTEQQVPYTAHTQRSSLQKFLPLHRDQSAHSAVIALNEPGKDFTGGGTYISVLNEGDFDTKVVSPEIGNAACFSGNILHSGDPVLSGCRYIIAAFFVLYDIEESQKLNGDEQLSKKQSVENHQEIKTFSFSFF